MSSVELAEKIEKLSSEDYNFMISLVDRLSENERITGRRVLSEDDLVKEHTESIESRNKGFTKSARDASANLRKNIATRVITPENSGKM